jgi:hypothetical protein
MSTKRLKRHAAKLLSLHKASTTKRMSALKRQLASKDFVKCICECCKNILNGNIELSQKQRSALKKRKNAIRTVVKRNTSMTKRKKIIQSGGFLGAILGPIVSVLSGLLSK